MCEGYVSVCVRNVNVWGDVSVCGGDVSVCEGDVSVYIRDVCVCGWDVCVEECESMGCLCGGVRIDGMCVCVDGMSVWRSTS